MIPGRRSPTVLALDGLLAGLGAAMAVASGRSDRFRRQVTRDLILAVRSDDGAGRTFTFHATTRRMTSTRRAAPGQEVTLHFATARDGLRTLLSRRAVGRLVHGMNFGGTRIDGNPALILWFHGLTRIVAPLGRSRVPRHRVPIGVRDPETHAPYAARIVREPPVTELDPAWTAAWAARRKLLQLRGTDGAPLPPG